MESIIAVRPTKQAVKKYEEEYQKRREEAHFTRGSALRPALSLGLPGGGRVDIGRVEVDTERDTFR